VRAATATEAAEAADWAVVTVPLKALDAVPVAPLAGKIVLDTGNYYWERDGHIAELDEKRATTTGLLQRHPVVARREGVQPHPGRRHPHDGLSGGHPGRRALAIASDHADAAALATEVYDAFGFDTVDIGSVGESWRVERDQPAYVVRQDADELREPRARRADAETGRDGLGREPRPAVSAPATLSAAMPRLRVGRAGARTRGARRSRSSG
jgi:predicted dinucleotide-binding enzyme